MQWKHVNSLPPRKFRTQTSAGKNHGKICMILTSPVLLQYTRVTDDKQMTTYYDNSRTLQEKCNDRLKRITLKMQDCRRPPY